MSDLLDEVERPISAAEAARRSRILRAMRHLTNPPRYLTPQEEILQTKERNRDLLRAEVLAAIAALGRPTTRDILESVPRNRNAVHLTILEMEKEDLIRALRGPWRSAAFWSIRPAGLEFLDSLFDTAAAKVRKNLEVVVEEGGSALPEPGVLDVEGKVLLGVHPGVLEPPVVPITSVAGVVSEPGLEDVQDSGNGVEKNGLGHQFPMDNPQDSLVEPVDLDEFDVGPRFKEVLELIRGHASDSAPRGGAGEEKRRERTIYIDEIDDF